MSPAVTVISSGDNEGHDHPRPSIIAASATTGHLEIHNDDLITPLVYSTETACSASFGHPSGLSVKSSGQTITLTGASLRNAKLAYKQTRAGERRPEPTPGVSRRARSLPG